MSTLSPRARSWIDALQLEAHPRGGWFREAWQSAEPLPVEALPGRFPEGRTFGASWHFVCTEDAPRRFHRRRSDALWLWQGGNPLTLHLLDEDGGYAKRVLGPNVAQGERLQVHVPHGTWCAAETAVPGSDALVSLLCVPACADSDVEEAGLDAMLGLYPAHESLLRRLS